MIVLRALLDIGTKPYSGGGATMPTPVITSVELASPDDPEKATLCDPTDEDGNPFDDICTEDPPK